MKRPILLASLGALLLAFTAAAADSNSPEATAQPAPAPEAQPAPPVKLPYGADDVLKLSKAQISDDIIVNYVQNSGTIYNLAPKDIVYLRNEGVSDRVLNAMLAQRNQVAMAQPAQPQVVAPTAQVPNAPTVGDAPAPAPYYDQAPDIVTAPATPPASSLYVIPYPSASPAYYGYYSPYYASPSYYSYPGYYGYYGGPVVSFGFGFGGFRHFGGFHGGFHEGGFHGGFRGGGFHGGFRGVGGFHAGHR